MISFSPKIVYLFAACTGATKSTTELLSSLVHFPRSSNVARILLEKTTRQQQPTTDPPTNPSSHTPTNPPTTNQPCALSELSESTREPFAVWIFAKETPSLCAAPRVGRPRTSVLWRRHGHMPPRGLGRRPSYPMMSSPTAVPLVKPCEPENPSGMLGCSPGNDHTFRRLFGTA